MEEARPIGLLTCWELEAAIPPLVEVGEAIRAGIQELIQLLEKGCQHREYTTTFVGFVTIGGRRFKRWAHVCKQCGHIWYSHEEVDD